MFTKKNKIINTQNDLANYIDGYDVYNSKILENLNDQPKVRYLIRTFEYRPDLIALDIYGSVDYMGFLLITCGTGLESYAKGNVIEVLPKSTIDLMINII